MFKLNYYIFKEHVGPFFLALMIILFLLIVNFLIGNVERLLGKGLPIQVILEFIVLNLAWIVALVIPMAVLVATLIAFGRLSADNEIIALKSAGVNLYKLAIFPVCAAGILCSVLIYFNNYIVPDANYRASTLKRDIIKKKPTLLIEEGVFVDEIPNHKILVRRKPEDPNSPKIFDILIYDFSDPKYQTTISAEEGELTLSQDGEFMVMTLFNGELTKVETRNFEELQVMKFDKQVITMEADLGFSRDDEYKRQKRDVEKTLDELKATIEADNKIISNTQNDINKITKTVFDFYYEESENPPMSVKSLAKTKNDSLSYYKFIGNVNRRNLSKVGYLLKKISNKEENIKQNLVEIHKKYAIPVACIVFVLLGMPLGILFRKSGISVGGSISMLFFLVYYAFLIQGEALADKGIISPFLGMWSANIILTLLGFFLLFWAIEEKKVTFRKAQ
ncbi:MAG: YjgP/YjgQ family permease [Calditrichaeota bacterium]|nr:MAG: YjgP/YjgQ family permease [Calditrichota bacterium]